jgi:hypothetical protein
VNEEEKRRRSDGLFGWVTTIWDWIDERDIDKHVISVFIMYGTIRVTSWAMTYASAHSDKTGIEVAAIIAAVSAPYMALQAAALKFYFDARTA